MTSTDDIEVEREKRAAGAEKYKSHMGDNPVHHSSICNYNHSIYSSKAYYI